MPNLMPIYTEFFMPNFMPNSKNPLQKQFSVISKQQKKWEQNDTFLFQNQCSMNKSR